jgi:hypothetical protein
MFRKGHELAVRGALSCLTLAALALCLRIAVSGEQSYAQAIPTPTAARTGLATASPIATTGLGAPLAANQVRGLIVELNTYTVPPIAVVRASNAGQSTTYGTATAMATATPLSFLPLSGTRTATAIATPSPTATASPTATSTPTAAIRSAALSSPTATTTPQTGAQGATAGSLSVGPGAPFGPPTGDVTVYISDLAILPGLGLNEDVTFSGTWIAPNVMQATYALYHVPFLALATPTPTLYAYDPYGYSPTATTYDNSGYSYDNYSYGSDNTSYAYDNSTYAYDNSGVYSPSVWYCGLGEQLSVQPEHPGGALNTSQTLDIELSGASCEGSRVMARFKSGSVNSAASILPGFAALDSTNHTELRYTGTVAGQDTLVIWLEGIQDGQLSADEPSREVVFVWGSPTATPTPTRSPTSTPTRTPTATPTKTP